MGVLSVALKINVEHDGKTVIDSVSLFKKDLKDYPSTTVTSHRMFALVGGFIGIIFGLVSIIIGSLSLKNNTSDNLKNIITILVLTILAVIISAIAFKFNRDLSSYSWWADNVSMK